jgi:hypothetical protein
MTLATATMGILPGSMLQPSFPPVDSVAVEGSL